MNWDWHIYTIDTVYKIDNSREPIVLAQELKVLRCPKWEGNPQEGGYIQTRSRPTWKKQTVKQVYSSEIKTHTHTPNLHGRPVYRSTLLGCKSKGRLKGGPRGEARKQGWGFECSAVVARFSKGGGEWGHLGWCQRRTVGKVSGGIKRRDCQRCHSNTSETNTGSPHTSPESHPAVPPNPTLWKPKVSMYVVWQQKLNWREDDF